MRHAAPVAPDQVFDPSLANCKLGKRMGFSGLGSDVHYRAAVPPENIDAIWHPGDEAYDRHRGLPRS